MTCLSGRGRVSCKEGYKEDLFQAQVRVMVIGDRFRGVQNRQLGEIRLVCCQIHPRAEEAGPQDHHGQLQPRHSQHSLLHV